MRRARREWPVRVEKDFSFGARAYAGDRWLLVGDAGSFLDPVFSTGVAIALESGVEAARSLDRALAAGDLSARAFTAFGRRQRQRYRSFRRFVLAFYTRSFRELFFVPAPPVRIFHALVTSLAGYWRPSVGARAWQALFFLNVWLRERRPRRATS
jgi:2-polyprenyl-6-methoxyphenol hydroxylase-like FAD-dependent oxidoreductase